MNQYQIGQLITGKITGIQDYGVFVQLDPKTQGLVHISECRSGLVDDIERDYQVGDEVEVVVLDIDYYSGKISLSMRQVGIPMAKADPHLANNSMIRKHFWTNHHLDLGFAPIAKNKQKWVDEALSRVSEKSNEKS